MASAMPHIPPGTLERFLAGQATRSEGRQIVAHLLRGCATCAAILLRANHPPVSEQAYDVVMDRVIRRLAAEWGSLELPVPRRISASSPW
jgi:hypothetical protein